MHEYYFKIKKADIEFEFSTTDKITFEQQLSDWINGIVRGDYVEAPPNESVDESVGESADEQPQRSGFIDIKNLTSINDIAAPSFDIEIEKVEAPPLVNFETTLEEAVQNPKTEVVEKTDAISDFEGYLTSHNPQNAVDNLIITAKYILGVENKERFTIKQINAKLVPSGFTPVDHSIIENAISQSLVKLIPDLTGTSDFTEYTLTDEGENYFID